MLERLRYSMRAMQVLSRTQEVVANNLANLNTAGFKKDKLFFHAFQDQVNGQQMRGTETNQMINIAPGEFKQTGNPFDLAIEGNGFFEVEHEGQTFMTRSGRFRLDSQGYLRDENNAYVKGMRGAIHIPEVIDMDMMENQEKILEIAKDGTIRLNDMALDKIKLVKVENLEDLQRQTNSYFKPTDGTQVLPAINSSMTQGFYETGNIEPLEEMSNMMTSLRLFESQQKAMRSMDDILSNVTQNLGRFR